MVVNMSAFAYRSLISQLVNFEEGRNEIINDLFEGPSDQRDEFEAFLSMYVDKLSVLVENVSAVERPDREQLKQLNYLPFVVIGSTVELFDKGNGKSIFYKLVSPYDNKAKEDLSYTSELGKYIILKKEKDIIRVQSEQGLKEYMVKSIKYES